MTDARAKIDLGGFTALRVYFVAGPEGEKWTGFYWSIGRHTAGPFPSETAAKKDALEEVPRRLGEAVETMKRLKSKKKP